MDNELERLQQAVEQKNLKLLILKMLYLNGTMKVDASENVLDKSVEQAIIPAPQENWN